MRIAGLDVGERRIGVAVSDELKMTAQPLTVLRRRSMEDDFRTLSHILDPFTPTQIVVGLPINMNGTLGPSAARADRFACELKKALKIPVVMWDERLSTVAVEKMLIGADVSRAKRREVVDKLAAAYILQSFLDNLRSRGDK